MGHYFNSAVTAYGYGETFSYYSGHFIEHAQGLTRNLGLTDGWSSSYYTPEDLPSDKQGSFLGGSLRAFDNPSLTAFFISGYSVKPILANPSQWWNVFLGNAGAVNHVGKAYEILVRDVKTYDGSLARTYQDAIDFQKNREAHKCLCDGDVPKQEYR